MNLLWPEFEMKTVQREDVLFYFINFIRFYCYFLKLMPKTSCYRGSLRWGELLNVLKQVMQPCVDIKGTYRKGRKPQWNSYNFRPLRQNCIKNQHASVMEISSWSWKYFDKPFSLNTICHCIHKCKLRLYNAQQKWYVNYAQKRCWPLWTQA